ncbi:MAG TPA: type I 3-dehydroquinate dehydratase [Ramlibacter sp.]|nr:type I 3-dehydroquinate dehydratase [Ramlibacter sp.]
MCGGEFGSALTFAVGQAASAPGQMPIEELRSGLAVLQGAGVPTAPPAPPAARPSAGSSTPGTSRR